MGNPKLTAALARYYSSSSNSSNRRICGALRREIDPMAEVVVTCGAAEALFCAVLSVVDPGDEVIVLEPFYDVYPANVVMAGGTPVFVPLHPPPANANANSSSSSSSGEWRLDMGELERAVTGKTKALYLNTPQNVPGKVWSREELDQLAAFAVKHDLLVIADEVYDRLVFKDSKDSKEEDHHHVRIGSLPNMWERTITIGSAGKLFSVTGWKIGWAVASPPLAAAMAAVHALIPFSVATPLQLAVATSLEDALKQEEEEEEGANTGYFAEMHALFSGKRERLLAGLGQSGLGVVAPQGSYFAVCDISGVPVDRYYDKETGEREGKDYHFCRWMTREVGVTAIPCSAFYSEQHKHMGERYVRFAFCKRDESIDEACKRLRNAF
eukprot:TRINITY_DN10336_c2_g2_i4.p1 TRINITY_DN10336_c2_g2~~TRINITY_DN10336_c2_g2_i4.p1  ORF type:complete len:383 (-),score=78.17 TRINITY_DN10336_c2_g2_i4:116-1264(-)